MKVLVGLGNPGRQYVRTRHNVGFDVIATLCQRHASGAKVQNKFKGELVDATIHGQRVMMLCPSTYMNRSGDSVGDLVDFYKLPLDEVLVICDDFQLPLGRLRIRASGTSGGQKGLDSIIRRLGSNNVPRLRIGIGPVPEGRVPSDFVLGKFAPDEQATADDAIRKAASAAELWITEGTTAAMNRYNSADDREQHNRQQQSGPVQQSGRDTK